MHDGVVFFALLAAALAADSIGPAESLAAALILAVSGFLSWR